MTVQTRSTKKPVSGSLSLGIKQKQPIYISETDGRAKDPAYLKSHPGQIIVLSEQEYALWLRQEYISTSSDGVSLLLNDDETTSLYGSIDQTIGLPGIPVWNTSDISSITTDTGVFQNIVVSFDTSSTDPLDGSYTYHVHYTPTTNTPANTTGTGSTPTPTSGATGSSGSSAPGSTVLSPVGAITTVNHTSSFFAISWNALSNAISYTVTVNGTNVPYSSPTSGSTSFVIPSAGGSSASGNSDELPIATGSLNFGIFTFVLNQLSGAFSGTYYLSIQANYATGSSAGVSYNVTI